jgi:hypothetical protein
MTVTDRIAQLERRVDLMSEYLKEADLLDFYSCDRALSIRLQITNQIQALKWVEESFSPMWYSYAVYRNFFGDTLNTTVLKD